MTNLQLLPLLKSSSTDQVNLGLKELYRQHYPVVANYVQQNSGTKVDAEDVFQDGLIALYEQIRIGTFMEKSTIKTYLFAICRNIWLKRLRKTAAYREIEELDSEIMDQASIVIDNMIVDESTKKLADLIDELGGDCKKNLLLFYYERKRMKEIAEINGYANEQVAKNKKNKCLKKLKAMARKYNDLNPFFS